jgi:hypothetical protein
MMMGTWSLISILMSRFVMLASHGAIFVDVPKLDAFIA